MLHHCGMGVRFKGQEKHDRSTLSEWVMSLAINPKAAKQSTFLAFKLESIGNC